MVEESKTSAPRRDGRAGRPVIHVLLGFYAAVLGYILLGLLFRFNVSAAIFFGLSFALLFFTLGQSIYELGLRRALLFLLLTGVIGFLAEVLGTNSGFPFGKYYYTNFLGEKFLGVPIVVPLVWFVITYLCYSIASGRSGEYSSVARIVLLAAFGAVAWDFMIDPMFSSYGYWVWTGQFLPLPELDGIPLTNFVGWFVLVSLMILICLYVIPAPSGKPAHHLLSRENNLDSIIAYVLLMIDGVIANYSLGNYGVIALGLVAMIGFLALSAMGSGISAKKLETVGVPNRSR